MNWRKATNVTLVFCFILLGFQATAKDKIEKGFERLAVLDYFNARQFFLDSKGKNPVPACLGLSIIACRNDNPFFNIDSARILILVSDSVFNNLPEKKKAALKEDYNIGLENILAQKDSVAFIAFQLTAKENDVSKWNDFIEKYSYSKLIESAVVTRNNLAYAKARKENTSAAYKDFLELYGSAAEAIEVKRQYEERLFIEKTQDGSEDAFANFIADYPKSPYRLQAEDSLFAVATVNKSPAEYYFFIKKYSANRHKDEAWMKLYYRYLEINGQNSFQKFLNEYPDFPYRKRVVADFNLYNTTMLPVRKADKWGFVADDGRPGITEEYDEVDDFSEGLCAVAKNGRYGYINKSGKMEIDFLFDEADPFENNLATVKLNGRTMLINREGQATAGTSVSKYDDVGTLHDDRILVLEKGKYGFIDAQGRLAIPVQYESATDFNDGIAVAGIEGKSGVIDREGQWIIVPDYSFVSIEENGFIKVKRDNKFGLFNRYGENILPVEYEAIGKFSNGLALVAKDNKAGYINISGQVTIPLTFDFEKEIYFRNRFKDGYAIVKVKNKTGLIDSLGNKTTPAIYDDIRFGTSTVPVAVKKQGKWGYINPVIWKPEGTNVGKKPVIPFKYDDASEYAGGYASVKFRGHYGVIDVNGKTIIPFQYDFVSPFKNGVAIVKKNKLFGLITIDNTQLIPIEYDKYEWMEDARSSAHNRLIKFELDDKFCYYDVEKKNWVWREDGL